MSFVLFSLTAGSRILIFLTGRYRVSYGSSFNF